MLADMSTPNGQTVPQGPNSPSGKCSINRYTFLQSAKNHCMHTHSFSFNQIHCSKSMNPSTLFKKAFRGWNDNCISPELLFGLVAPTNYHG